MSWECGDFFNELRMSGNNGLKMTTQIWFTHMKQSPNGSFQHQRGHHQQDEMHPSLLAAHRQSYRHVTHDSTHQHYEPHGPPLCHWPGHMDLWYRKTLPNNTIDDLAVFHIRIFGAGGGMSYVCLMLEALAFEQSNEWLRCWFSQCSIVGHGLCLVGLVWASLETSGYALNETWAPQSIVQLVQLMIQVSDVLWPWDAQVTQKSTIVLGETVPWLAVVEDGKKENWYIGISY